MTNDLPEFDRRPYQKVHGFISRALTHGEQTSLKKLIAYKDGHYRALFSADFFTLAEDRTEPSKSQWNTLKKRLRRMDNKVFVLKQHGTADCDTGSHETVNQACYYIDFGFFKD